ncbi:hypothetical protein J19TS2_14500 [Cohnella xylanilytica]|uniref:Uncharacterized protein n=1 Tax=Cohnella xylanilytica TaxID=557555 RepID=A0A841TYK0_9BACL|nr:hypothetical protein [Cohnella xylanilytica]MBB6692639.1 hypothetical protein [Cohnella xylanilytica]GIO11895.1 hypothetical protein J19TS2_14500 [Cohnella xylanilytica]
MLVIGYAVFAILVIVILIVFNVKASKRAANGKEPNPIAVPEDLSDRERPPGGAKPEPLETLGTESAAGNRSEDGLDPGLEKEGAAARPDPADGEARAGEAPRDRGAGTPSAGRDEPDADSRLSQRSGAWTRTNDRHFRQALRQLKTGADESEPHANEALQQEKIISDTEYRKALHNLRKPKDDRP